VRVTLTLVCTGSGTHRAVKVYVYDGPWPLPPEYTTRVPGSTLDLNCPRCRFAPRPGDDGMRALLEAAAARPGHTLDINPPPRPIR
jgi:hypothetical protein